MRFQIQPDLLKMIEIRNAGGGRLILPKSSNPKMAKKTAGNDMNETRKRTGAANDVKAEHNFLQNPILKEGNP